MMEQADVQEVAGRIADQMTMHEVAELVWLATRGLDIRHLPRFSRIAELFTVFNQQGFPVVHTRVLNALAAALHQELELWEHRVDEPWAVPTALGLEELSLPLATKLRFFTTTGQLFYHVVGEIDLGYGSSTYHWIVSPDGWVTYEKGSGIMTWSPSPEERKVMISFFAKARKYSA